MAYFLSRRGQLGLTLMEIGVALGIVLLLLGFSAPFLLNYRGKSAVNRGVELVKVLAERASEQAKTDGYPLPETLKASGLTTASQPSSSEGSSLRVQIRRRLRSGDSLQVVSNKSLDSSSVVADFLGFGLLDIEGDSSQLGYFLEFVEESESGQRTLATIPIDVNGEFVLAENASEARLRLRYGDYQRTVTFRYQGTVTLDRR